LRLVNFEVHGRAGCAAVTADGIIDLTTRLAPPARNLLELIRSDPAGQALARARELVRAGGVDYALQDVRIGKPVGRDTRYFCIGVNYPERNEEYKDGSERPKYPSIFMRSHTSLVAHGEPIVRPRESVQLDYEGEIVVLIGRGGRRISQAHALEHVFGYTCGNEGSVRDWLRHAKFNVTQGKNFDRSGAIGPWVVTADEIGTAPLTVRTRVNGELRQDDVSERMIFGLPYLIAYLSSFCTLEPGDVIFTGTPSGAGARFDPPRYLAPGDVVEVEVSGVGVLRNTVIDDES
jgi:2-keto-4-pentenoate hydratase/2-oxohepta-3-ene-1,7-dioic acid hydratase in catechol pathway